MRRVVHVSGNFLAQFFDACRVLRVSFVVSMFAFIVLGIPAQTREVYRVLADDFPNQHWQVAFGFVGLLLASGFIWHCGRAATFAERRHALPIMSIEGALLRWMPRLLAALVPLGASLGLYTTIREAQTTASLVKTVAAKQNWPELSHINELIDATPTRLWVATGIAIGLVLVVLLATILRTSGRSWKYASPGRWLVGKETTLCCGVIVFVCIFLFSVSPPALAQSIGVVAIFALFLVVLVVVLSYLFLLGDRLGIPLILVLAGAAVLFTSADWNDNHRVAIVRHQRTHTGRSNSARRSSAGTSRAPTPISTQRAASPIRFSSWPRPAEALMRRTTRRRCWPGCRTAVRILPSTFLPSVAFLAAASERRCSRV